MVHFTVILTGFCIVTKSSLKSDNEIHYLVKLWTNIFKNEVPPASLNLNFVEIVAITEKIVVRNLLYPTLYRPPTTLSFADQFAFRPSGSTSAALVLSLFCTLSFRRWPTWPYIVVVALDFCKAFDTERHMAKVAQLNLPDNVHNCSGTTGSDVVLHRRPWCVTLHELRL